MIPEIDRTELPTSELDLELQELKPKSSTVDSIAVHILLDEDHRKSETEKLSTKYKDHVRAIGILMRDHGHTQKEVLQFEDDLPAINNTTDSAKDALLEELQQKRIGLAISNYPLYLNLLSSINPENPEQFSSLREEYSRNKTTDARKAEISEGIREELGIIIHSKTIFYTEMLKTVMIDSGVPPEKAEEIALLKAETITTRANSILEKTASFDSLKKQALTHLISHLHLSILVWEEMFPGEGETEESKILGEGKETRMKNAKELYKRSITELEKRHDDYKLRAENHFKTDGNNNGHDIPWGLAYKKATESTNLLLNKPRLEQIQIMKSGEFIQPS